ncbi:MAG: MlaD family protein, partial [Acidimicrobiales bacterium]|nr:MlaD family protein [Acidimicrobiales bacterium]
MMNEPPPRMLACLGLVSAVFCTGLVAVLLAYGRGEFDANYDVTAVFPSSSQGVFTDGGTEVKVRGVPVGTVRGVRLLADGRAEVTLRLDDDVRVPDTVEARLEPLSVFGPKFVDLVPGAGEGEGPFLDEGDRITRAVTGTELTEVLDGASRLFQAIDPVDLVTVFDAVSEG